MKICFLGTGSAVATAQRDNTSVFVETQDWNLLLDCPGSIIHKLAKLSIDCRNIDGIFITHSHPDHIYGLPSVIHSLVPWGRFPKIFVPEGFMYTVVSLLGIFGLDEKVEITGVAEEIEDFKIELFPTRHTAHSRGVRILKEKKNIIYTSDTGPIENSDVIFKDADYLIHDCFAPLRFKKDSPAIDSTHTSAETLGKTAQTCGMKNLVPIHFSGELEFSIEEVIEEIKKFYSGNLIIPNDLDCLETS
jgi:ribonuclease Z